VLPATTVAASTPPKAVTLPAAQTAGPASADSPAAVSLEDVERRHIESVLKQANWMIEGERGAAKILNLHPSTLRSRMQKLGIKRPA